MTICIGAICERGSSLILASDTMITNATLSIQFEHKTRKMTSLSDLCIALTAGDALAYTELFNAVQSEIARLREPSIGEIVSKIKECYQAIRELEIKERILNPRGFADFQDFYRAQNLLVSDVALSIQMQIDSYDYGLDILVAGISQDVAHIYGIFDPGTSKCFDSIGFHAIGSGLSHAVNTLIVRGHHQEMPMKEAFIVTYEAKKMAEKAPGVGNNITDICIMTPRQILYFPRDRVEELHGIYEKWVQRDPDWANELDNLFKEIEG